MYTAQLKCVCACLAQGPINLLAVVKQATAEGKEKKSYM